MNCIIPGQNLKGKALQALSRIGDELFITAKHDRLHFITLNTSKTVCARFQFLDSFFSTFTIDDGDESPTCKLHMKVVLPLFKGNLEKKLDFFKIIYENNNDFLIFEMKYQCDDIKMTHNLRLMENESLSIDIGIDSGSNNICATSAFYNQLLSMFNRNDNEITLEITKNKVIGRNYCDGTPLGSKCVRCQISLYPSEFNSFAIINETIINFSLRPLRTAVQFADGFNLDIGFNFEHGGTPMTIIMKSTTFEVNFIVATLNPNADMQSSMSTTTLNRNVVTVNNEKNAGSNRLSTALVTNQCADNSVSNGSLENGTSSPMSKKAKLVFGRCYESTFCERSLGDVLVDNSDSD